MKPNRTFIILGITGGAGSGKTTVVEKIKTMTTTVFLHCDVIAHELMQPGGASYAALLEEFGKEILEESMEGSPISRPKLAAVAMATEQTRLRLNRATHPQVRKAVEDELLRLTKERFDGVVLIEAALLIEAGYKEICDSLWYVHAPLSDRIRRMREKRSYSEEKIANILAGQLTEEEFLAQADVVIENPDIEKEDREHELLQQIEFHLKECMETRNKMW